MSAHPRVLFVTPHAFNALTGGGVTFSNLFRGWPKDRLATVHNDPVPTSDDVCAHYYRLGADEIDLAPPLAWARRLRRARRAAGDTGEGPQEPAPDPPSGGLLGGLLGDSIPQAARLTPALEDWIAAFRPEVLYTILGSNALMALIDRIRRRFALPLVVHFMDDWPEMAHRRGLCAPVMRRRMDRLVRRLAAEAAVAMGISPAMCECFAARYGRPFVPFQNTVDLDRWEAVLRRDAQASGPPFDLLYVGSVFANAQLASLLDAAAAVEAAAEDGLDVRLSIASPPFLIAPHAARFAVFPRTRILPPITDDDAFFRRIAAADALLLPANFDADSVGFIRYSMPTKVPAYLASGTPVLVYGPAETAQVAYARAAGWGEVVDTRSVERLKQGLGRIMTDRDRRDALFQAAKAAARENHDAARVRARFRATLAEAAARKGARP